MKLGNPIAEGNTAAIYLHNNKVIKLFHESLPETEAAYEAKKQEFAYLSGLPVPKVYDVTRINGRPAILMEHIKGRTLGDILMENMEQVEVYMNVFVDMQQRIHSIEANSLESMSERLASQISSAPELSLDIKSALIHKLHSMPFGKGLCHGDFHFYNLIMLENELVIIDWVDASSGDIRADVYRTYLLYTQVSQEIADMYLASYCAKTGWTKEEIFQWAPLIAAARLAEHVSSEDSERLLKIIMDNLEV